MSIHNKHYSQYINIQHLIHIHPFIWKHKFIPEIRTLRSMELMPAGGVGDAKEAHVPEDAKVEDPHYTVSLGRY